MNKSLTECEAEYNDFYIDGKKYVRIQTFGSDERQVKGKQSQVIHIDRNTAKQLVELAKKFFLIYNKIIKFDLSCNRSANLT